MDVTEQIKETIENNPIVIFMKGTPDLPQCGFSMRASQALAGCTAEFAYVNVLEDERIRDGVKQFGNWPTIPQLYINGELVGGHDIILELYQNGELKPMMEAAGKAPE